MGYAAGEELELDLHGFSPDGRTVGRSTEGMTVFTLGGMPGQRVRVRLNSVKKRMAEAELIHVIAHAPEERSAPCPHAEVCGGCPWQCMPYASQKIWKQRMVFDALTRIGRLELTEHDIRPLLSTEQEWHFRNKMEFAFGADSAGRLLLGLRSRASRTVVDVTDCLLQSRRTMDILAALRTLCAQAGLSAAQEQQSRGKLRQPGAFSKAVHQSDILRFAVIREPAGGGCLVELITLPSPQEARTLRKLGEKLLEGPWGVTGFVHSVRSAPSAVAFGEETVLCLGDTSLTETLTLQGRPVQFRLDHNSFFQVNSRAAELLYNTASGMAQELFDGTEDLWGRHCWDIYCGVGGLALTMAPHFKTVFGMEVVPQAVELATQNAAQFCSDHSSVTKFRFNAGDAAVLESCFRQMGSPDLLVTDPPRAGMDGRTVQAILKHRPPRLVLVSCNPSTLARDLALLAPSYRIHGIQPVDLFPQTPHVESIVSLLRK